MTDFLDEMDQLAAEIAKSAREAATDLSNKIDAFKALTPYWVHKTKKLKPDDSEVGTFEGFAERIHAIKTETLNGEGKSGLRSGRRDGE